MGRTLDTNYWGLKNVVNAFIPKLSDTARIVNMSSNYSMLKMIPGREIRNILGKPDLSEKDLDELMMEYQRRSTEFNDDFAELGFPRCAYTVSKVAVNAYTRILQRGFEQRGKPGVVVRSIHPGSYHSKITQEGDPSQLPRRRLKLWSVRLFCLKMETGDSSFGTMVMLLHGMKILRWGVAMLRSWRSD